MANMTSSLSDALAARLIEGALPGEIEGLTAAERTEAAAFVAQTAAGVRVAVGMDAGLDLAFAWR